MKPAIVEKHEGIYVVRDDYLPGGTKLRYLHQLYDVYDHVIYASPAFGGAQLALAVAASMKGKQCSIFTAQRKKPHPRTLATKKAGARVFMVKGGYLKVVQSKAKLYAKQTGGHYLEFGGESQETLKAIAAAAKEVNDKYGPFDQVWSAAGSGVLTRGLQLGMPDAKEFHAVQVGRDLDKGKAGRATVHKYPLPFEKELKIKVPFDSCPNYDRKAWHICKQKSKGKVLFWNVLGRTR